MSLTSYRRLPGIPDVSFYTHQINRVVKYISVYEPRVINILYQELEPPLHIEDCRCNTCTQYWEEEIDFVSIAVYVPYMTISHKYRTTTTGHLTSEGLYVYWSLSDPFRNKVDLYPMPLPNIWYSGRYCSGDIEYPEFTSPSVPKKRLHWVQDYSIIFDQPFNDDLIDRHCQYFWSDFFVGKYSPWIKKSKNKYSLFEKEPFTEYVSKEAATSAFL